MTRFGLTGHLGWIAALAKANLRSAVADRGNFIALTSFMALNNLIWFSIWWLFFAVTGEIRGWTVSDVAALYGIVAVAFGIHTTFFGGARTLAQKVRDGALDVYLGRPRSALVGVLFSRSDPTGLGDILSGAGMVLWVTAATPEKAVLALGFALLGASVIVASYLAINCLAFISRGRSSVSDQLCESFLMLASMPQVGLPGVVKILTYSALPAAFVGFVPVEILRDFSAAKLLEVVAAAIVCPLAATGLFHLGLRRYSSGNRMIELR